MRCRKCGRTAVVNMRQHKLALCKEHYLEWFLTYTQRTIERYHMFTLQDRILVAVSGGKDSLSLWDVLLRLGYSADGLYIDLGIEGGYSTLSREKAEAFAQERGARLMVLDIKATYGLSIPELMRGKRGRSPCAVCGLVKRHELNRLTYEGGYTALATGHNLDDEVAVLFQNVLRWKTGYLARQAPVLPSTHPRLARRVKPFVRMYERDTAAYALLRGIDYILDECPHSLGATTLFYKDLFNQLEEQSRGAKLSFYLSFLKARHLFRPQELELGECERCGQPTSAPVLCAFCRLWDRADEPNRPAANSQ